MNQHGINVNVTEAIANEIIDNYVENIRNTLLEGNDFILKGIGTLRPSLRKVKNDKGRPYAIRVKLVQSKKFHDDLVGSYEKDNTKFSRFKKEVIE